MDPPFFHKTRHSVPGLKRLLIHILHLSHHRLVPLKQPPVFFRHSQISPVPFLMSHQPFHRLLKALLHRPDQPPNHLVRPRLPAHYTQNPPLRFLHPLFLPLRRRRDPKIHVLPYLFRFLMRPLYPRLIHRVFHHLMRHILTSQPLLIRLIRHHQHRSPFPWLLHYHRPKVFLDPNLLPRRLAHHLHTLDPPRDTQFRRRLRPQKCLHLFQYPVPKRSQKYPHSPVVHRMPHFRHILPDRRHIPPAQTPFTPVPPGPGADISTQGISHIPPSLTVNPGFDRSSRNGIHMAFFCPFSLQYDKMIVVNGINQFNPGLLQSTLHLSSNRLQPFQDFGDPFPCLFPKMNAHVDVRSPRGFASGQRTEQVNTLDKILSEFFLEFFNGDKRQQRERGRLNPLSPRCYRNGALTHDPGKVGIIFHDFFFTGLSRHHKPDGINRLCKAVPAFVFISHIREDIFQFVF